MSKSIYIHIPFCKTKCPYCDFASWAHKEYLVDDYFDALLKEIQTKCEAYKNLTGVRESIKSIFLGGGTPSLVAPTYYRRLFDELRKHFDIKNDCETTLELNPGTAREDFLYGYRELGVNRISIGVQSFSEAVLETLGRKHSVQDTIDTISKVQKTGFTNYSFDLIYGVPEMTKEIWNDTLRQTLDFNPKHISSYSLTVEPNTPFMHTYNNPSLLPSDDFVSSLYFNACSLFKRNDFVHYEVSNFAKAGYESGHNINYWLGDDFYAFGNGAHRYLNGLRTSNLRSIEAYINNPNLENIIEVTHSNYFEKMMLNSRLNEGLDMDLIKQASKKNREELKQTLEGLFNEGYIELSKNKVHLTDKGLFVNNEILLKLM